MTTPTLEQMVETGRNTLARVAGFALTKDEMHAVLLAVIEKHIGPMLVEAFNTGGASMLGGGPSYAARIIEQMKEKP
jgi:hypothetical protein